MRLDTHLPITRIEITLRRQGDRHTVSPCRSADIPRPGEWRFSQRIGNMNETPTILARTMSASKAKNVNGMFGQALIEPNEVPSCRRHTECQIGNFSRECGSRSHLYACERGKRRVALQAIPSSLRSTIAAPTSFESSRPRSCVPPIVRGRDVRARG